jgi:predicted nucleic acid-binding protein
LGCAVIRIACLLTPSVDQSHYFFYPLILSVLGRTQAAQFLKDMQESNTVILRVRASDEARAQQILFQYDDKDFSFADAISFAVMERLAIRLAFTFDRDFAQYGFTVLTAN